MTSPRNFRSNRIRVALALRAGVLSVATQVRSLLFASVVATLAGCGSIALTPAAQAQGPAAAPDAAVANDQPEHWCSLAEVEFNEESFRYSVDGNFDAYEVIQPRTCADYFFLLSLGAWPAPTSIERNGINDCHRYWLGLQEGGQFNPQSPAASTIWRLLWVWPGKLMVPYGAGGEVVIRDQPVYWADFDMPDEETEGTQEVADAVRIDGWTLVINQPYGGATVEIVSFVDADGDGSRDVITTQMVTASPHGSMTNFFVHIWSPSRGWFTWQESSEWLNQLEESAVRTLVEQSAEDEPCRPDLNGVRGGE